MSIARIRETDEQWVELPEPDLERYLLHTRGPAANDNRRLSAETFRTVQLGACVALIGAATLIGALI